MLHIDLHEIIAKLGNDLGLKLSLDEDGCCQLVIENETLINIRCCHDDGLMILSQVVAEDLPDPVSYPMILDIMDYALGPCYFQGGNSPVIGRDEETGFLVMYQVVTASKLAADDLGEILAKFISAGEAFAAMIEKNSVPAEPETDPRFVFGENGGTVFLES